MHATKATWLAKAGGIVYVGERAATRPFFFVCVNSLNSALRTLSHSAKGADARIYSPKGVTYDTCTDKQSAMRQEERLSWRVDRVLPGKLESGDGLALAPAAVRKATTAAVAFGFRTSCPTCSYVQ